MSFQGYREVHAVLDEFQLPAGDSFWLFDPSGSDMALFTHDLSNKGPRHDEILEEIHAGRIDVLHSAGSYGEKFNRGYRPNRKMIGGALEYLQMNGVSPKIWSNHGDVYNFQNLGGSHPSAHHQGDLPGSEAYVLDLLLQFGIEFFWLDRLLVSDAEIAYRIVGTESSRDGHRINTFTRFSGLPVGPNGQNLAQQLSISNLESLRRNQQSTVLYQHWGCDHDENNHAFTPEPGKTLGGASIEALRRLAEAHSAGSIRVCGLYELLKLEQARPLGDDAQRVGSVVVAPDQTKSDNFYFNQYNKHSVGYFKSRLENLQITGTSALDAGCGVGQWSFALADMGFLDVVGIDASEHALSYLAQMTDRLRQSSPRFVSGDIEKICYPNLRFDFLVSYGVIFCAHVDIALTEFFRVLRPGGKAYICLNADGWYQYLIDVRFRDSSMEVKRAYALPLWNAFYSRVGGVERFNQLLDNSGTSLKLDIQHSPLPVADARQLLRLLVGSDLQKCAEIVASYSDDIAQLLAEFCRACFHRISKERSFGKPNGVLLNTSKLSGFSEVVRSWRAKLSILLAGIGNFTKENPLKMERTAPSHLDYIPFIQLTGSTQNRAYQPDEFEKLAHSIGFEDFEWAPDGRLMRTAGEPSVHPIYESDYRGAPAVWECLLSRPV